jgi:hypothetical protein
MCRMIFSRAPGEVNWGYELGDPRNLFDGCREPKDWDKILDGYYLGVASDQHLSVDVTDTAEVIGDLYSPNKADVYLTLMGCFAFALHEYWIMNEQTHHPKLHAGWYETIEAFHKFDDLESGWNHFFFVEDSGDRYQRLEGLGLD